MTTLASRPPAPATTRVVVITLVIYTVFAIVTLATSEFEIYRVWARLAAPTYACATLIVALIGCSKRFGREHIPAIGVLVAVVGSVLLPLAVLIHQGLAMPEVPVIQRGAHELLHHGTPFFERRELTDINQYNPYLPGMALLGVVATGLHVDLRFIFGLAFIACVGVSMRLTQPHMTARSTLQPIAMAVGLLLVCPLIALPLVAGGDDLPVFGLICLGLGLGTSRSRRAAVCSGLAIGAACSLKAIALPAFPICLAVIACLRGKRAAAHYVASSAAVFIVIVAPSFLRAPDAFMENAVRFPLGLAHVATTARDPLPGSLIASNVPDGKAIALALLLSAGALIAGSLWLRPPASLHATTMRLALGMSLIFLLSPAVRWGYFAYPLGLWLWITMTHRITRLGRVGAAALSIVQPLATTPTGHQGQAHSTERAS